MNSPDNQHMQPTNTELSKSMPLTTEEPIRRPWLREEVEKVNGYATKEISDIEEDFQETSMIHTQNRIENFTLSEKQEDNMNISRGSSSSAIASGSGHASNSKLVSKGKDIMACLAREMDEHNEKMEEELEMFEKKTEDLEELFMNDPELISRTEKNKSIPYEPTPPISRDSSNNSSRENEDEGRRKLLVFSDKVDSFEDVDRITLVQYYGAGKTGVIPTAYRRNRVPKVYLVACDFSEESNNALEWVMGSMMRDGDEVHIAVISNREDNPEIVKASGLDKKGELKFISDMITKKAKVLLNKMMLLNIKLVTHTIVGRVKDKLNGLMIEYVFTMVVCGSRGRSPVQSSPIPVAVVRTPHPKNPERKRPLSSHSLSESMKAGKLHVDELS